MSRFWPPREACQVEYERLREQVLVGVDELDLASSRFRRLGLAAFISSPTVESRLVASVLGARRPRWSGLEDPRLDALAGAYSLLRASTETRAVHSRSSSDSSHNVQFVGNVMVERADYCLPRWRLAT